MTDQTKQVNNKEEEKQDVFKTTDFILSVFLLYSGIKLVDLEALPNDNNPNRKNFIFEKDDRLEELMNEYISTDPQISLKKFIATQRNLKRMIYNGFN